MTTFKKLTFVILLVLIFASILIFSLTKREVEDPLKEKAISQGFIEWLQKTIPKDLSLGNPLIFQDDCRDIKDKKERELCFWNEYMIRASTSGEINWCKKIKDLEYRDYCLRTLAEESNNIDTCYFIKEKEWKNICFMEIAHQNLDKSICEEIEYPFVEKKCIAQIDSEIGRKNQDMKKCLSIPKYSDFRNICIWDLVAKKRSKVCEKIEEGEDRNLCFDWYYLTLADKENKEEFCQKIIWERFKKVCFKVLELKKQGEEFYFQFDSDNDGVDDFNELGLNTDPFNQDTDKDGVSDSVELFTHHTDPLSQDTDNDGRKDGEEIKTGKDINKPD